MSSKLNNIFTMKKETWRIFKKKKFVMNSMSTAAMLAAMVFSASSAYAELPTSGSFVAGQGNIGVNGNTMDINQLSNHGIINWDSFSIGQGNVVNIANGAGATLNRVIANNPSSLMGQLNATGSVYLINQSGIVVGESGVINAGGNFVGSTLDVNNQQFMEGGELRFNGNSNAGVVNLGRISAGNDAILLGKHVLNNGTLESQNGTAGAAAGSEILLTDTNSASDRIYVQVGEGNVTNNGVINGVNAELKASANNIYAMAIQNDGVVRASGLSSQGGRLVLSSSQGIVENSGTLDASSTTGVGGDIKVEGRDIRLAPASMVNASGAYGGGDIKIGGGRLGQDSSIQNALNTSVAENAVIKADATVSGNGGETIVWSDNRTTFEGSISAQGKGEGADGGFAEVSGKNELVFASWDVSLNGGENGQGGTLLLDPRDINIVDGTGGSTFANTVTDGAMETFLNAGDGVALELRTTGSGGNGDINVDSNVSIAWNTNRSLVLTADRDINMAGTIDASASTGAANVRLNAVRDINMADNTIIRTGQGGTAKINAATQTQGSSTFSDWKTGNGSINFGDNVEITTSFVELKSGKAQDGTRADIGDNVKLNPANGSTYAGMQILGFDTVSLNSQNGADIETTSGSIIVNARNINIDESITTKGDLYLSAASFDDDTNDFVEVAASEVTDARDEFRSDGWKTESGTVNFANSANLVLDICCGVTITSGINNGARADLTSPDVTFEYNNPYNIYQWYEVKGFNNFDTTVEGNALASNSFVDIRNTNNVVNYDVIAGKDIPVNVDIPAGEAADAFGYVRIMGGAHDGNLEYTDNIFNSGTTTFDNSLTGSPLIVSAATDVTLTSGITNGSRTSITDATDTTPTGTSYAGRTDNVVFEHTDGNGQYDGDVRIQGFEEIALDTSNISGELAATGNISTYSSRLTNVNDNLTASNILAISEKDINLRNNSTLTTTGDTILVVDEATPFSVGSGVLTTGVNTTINAGRIALFTAKQGQNSIEGALNGGVFTEGLEYFDTSSEVWNSFYSANNRSARNPFVVYYKDDGEPVVVIQQRPDCASNPDAAGCESFVQGPDDRREYRVNLTSKDNDLGEDALRRGDSDDVRNTEYFTTGTPTYVDYRLTQAEKLKDFARAFPLQVVGTTLDGLNVIPGFSGVALAINSVTEGLTNVVAGGAR